MTREMALPYVSWIVDDALYACSVEEAKGLPSKDGVLEHPNTRLVGWQCGFEPLFVAIHSYQRDVRIDDELAEELATDYLAERKWFSGEPKQPDYIL